MCNKLSQASALVLSFVALLLLTLPLAAETVTPESAAAPTSPPVLDEEVQDLKAEVLNLNRELFLLEEELLFPANTQIAVFVSMDVGEFFALDFSTPLLPFLESMV